MTPEQAFEKWWVKSWGFTHITKDFVQQAFLQGIQYKELHQIGVLADIRKAVGDGEGKLMQEELVKRIEGLVSPWRPIETAPKDGTRIDLWFSGEFPGRRADCYWGKSGHECGEMGEYCDSDWHSEEPGWIDGTFNEHIGTMEPPTHWMPLTAGPVKSVTTEKEEA